MAFREILNFTIENINYDPVPTVWPELFKNRSEETRCPCMFSIIYFFNQKNKLRHNIETMLKSGYSEHNSLWSSRLLKPNTNVTAQSPNDLLKL